MMSPITHDCPSSRASQRVHPFAVRAHRFRHHERARNAAPLASPSLDPRARRRPRRQAVRGNTRRPSGARVARARHRGARVSGPEERPAQPDAWVERRRSLSGQQKHLSGADQASRPGNSTGKAPARLRPAGSPRERQGSRGSRARPRGPGVPVKRRRGHVTVISRAHCGLRTPYIWCIGVAKARFLNTLYSHLDPVLTLKCP